MENGKSGTAGKTQGKTQRLYRGGAGRGGKGGSEVTGTRGMGKATCMYICIIAINIYLSTVGDRHFSFFSSFIIFFLFSSFVASFFAVPVYFILFFFSGTTCRRARDTIRECTRSRTRKRCSCVYAIDYFGIHGCTGGGEGREREREREREGEGEQGEK